MACFIALIPVSLLLTLSFFVLRGVEKAEGAKLKTFGKAVAVFLWLASALVLVGGIRNACCGGPACMHRGPGMHGMMPHGQGMHGMPACPAKKGGEACGPMGSNR